MSSAAPTLRRQRREQRAHGIVTGGTGTLTGAITAKPASKTGPNSAITITYTS